MLMLHLQKRRDDNITTIKTSPDSRLHWKNQFTKNPLYFRICAAFEADNEKNISSVGNKTIIFHKQNPVLNGYHRISELEDVCKKWISPISFRI